MATTAVSSATQPSPSPTALSMSQQTTAASTDAMDEVTTQQPRVVSNNEHEKEDSDENRNPLSADLRRILTEVAQTGSCSWLSWNGQAERAAGGSKSRPNIDAGSITAAAAAGSLAGNRPLTSSAVGSAAAGRNFLAQFRNASSSAASASAYRASSPAASSRTKRHRNGLHVTRRQYSTENGTTTKTITVGSLPSARKRPLYLTRTPSSSTASVAGSIGSGRTSGSEAEQYEWDSEGTSTTTNSEISLSDRRDQRRRLAALQTSSASPSLMPQSSMPHQSSECKSLREVFQVALGRVLDHYYKHRGGYKLSPAEIRINEAAAAALKARVMENGNGIGGTEIPVPTAETTFHQRRKRLLARFGIEGATVASDQTLGDASVKKTASQNAEVDGPPFTIQRIAEVLVSPDRYYTQTHKLCNCLEKLLLVTSATNAFGGTGGGHSSQSRRENRELSALADERGRLDAEQRNRRLRRRMSSSSASSEEGSMESDKKVAAKKSSTDKAKVAGKTADNTGKSASSEGGGDGGSRSASAMTREQLEAAARASLRHKFDHIGHDPHGHGAVDRNVLGPNRGMTTSPPPPSLSVVGPSSMGGFVRHHAQGSGESSPDAHTHRPPVQRPPSPLLFSSSSEAGSPPSAAIPQDHRHSIHLLQLHHAAAMAGVPLGSAPRNMVIDPATGSGRPASGEVPDVEMERSSASNSDLDSESDDFSLDDSASDRSDGSDSGSGAPSHYEPFTAARVMALNRMQQQQRLQQNRMVGLGASAGLHPGENYRPPADSEYQSGDSIDSTLAEDSASDSSSVSSDMAD